ncbi:MAG: hypothetical protein ACOYOL_02570 [Chthoniobacterales bacterium]
MSTTVIIWSTLAPFLLLLWLFQRVSGLRGWSGFVLAAVLAVGALLVPWFGPPLSAWSAGLSANFSVIMAGLLFVAIAERTTGRPIFQRGEWKTAWIFGSVASWALYPSALGLGPPNFDSYALGWPWLFWGQSFVLFGAVTLTAAFLLWRGNRFGYLLLLTLAGYALGFQESDNLWDYLLDPVFGAVALLAGLRLIVLRLRQGSERAGLVSR